MHPELERTLGGIAVLVDGALDGYLPAEGGGPGRLAEAMRYSVFAGGKRFRPALCIMVCEALGGTREEALPAAAALEMIHTYSLIHDDLPAMDDDDLRRGKPSSHKVFGEATAILAGDGLLTLAFEVAAGSSVGAARICAELAGGAGPEGMVGGQAADMAAEGGGGGFEGVLYIHERKTAALIRAAARAGAVSAGASEERIGLAGEFGGKLGLLFQATDDILDETAGTKTLGKTAGKDVASGKLTVISTLGLEEARREAEALAEEASGILAEMADGDTILPQLVDYVLNRAS